MRLRSFLCSLVLLTALVGDSTFLDGNLAHAQFIGDRPFSGGRRNIEINLHAQTYYGYDWYGEVYSSPYTIGPGFSMLFPVVQNGFIRTINDAFYVGFFTDFNNHPYYGGYNGFGGYYSFWSVAIGPFVQWRFQLFQILSVYANVGFGIWPWFVGNGQGVPNGTVALNFFPLFALGANLHFTKNIGMNFEFGYPSAKLGLIIGF